MEGCAKTLQQRNENPSKTKIQQEARKGSVTKNFDRNKTHEDAYKDDFYLEDQRTQTAVQIQEITQIYNFKRVQHLIQTEERTMTIETVFQEEHRTQKRT